MINLVKSVCRAFVVATVVAFACFAQGQSVYEVTRVWSLEEEALYRAWVRENVTPDLMVRLNISTDCAQLPGVIRLIFSRIRGLPALIVVGENRFSHDSSAWGHLHSTAHWSEQNWIESFNEDLRFQAFVRSAVQSLSTHSLPSNTFPVALRDPEDPQRLSPWIAPGLMLQDERHVRMIFELNPGSGLPILEIQSTLPRRVRQLLVTPFSLFHFPTTHFQGFRSWRWPERVGNRWQLRAAERMPGFSLEQFQLPNLPEPNAAAELRSLGREIMGLQNNKKLFEQADPRRSQDSTVARLNLIEGRLTLLEDRVRALRQTLKLFEGSSIKSFQGSIQDFMMRLTQRTVPTQEELERLSQLFALRLNERVRIVEQASHVSSQSLRNPQSPEYYALSTPDRDHSELFTYTQTLRSFQSLDPSGDLTRRLMFVIRQQQIEVMPGIRIDLLFWYESLSNGFVKSEPHLPPHLRWGLGYASQLMETRSVAEAQLRTLQEAHRRLELIAEIRRMARRDSAEALQAWESKRAEEQLQIELRRSRLSVQEDHLQWIDNICQSVGPEYCRS